MPRSTHVTRSSHHIKTNTRTILLCSIIILGIGYTTFHPSANASTTITSNTSTAFDHVVVILMENHNLNDIIGSATYMTTLANTYSLATHYTAVSHPSEPNYIALVGGDTFGISSDGNCCWTINSPNIVDRIESAGLTWQAWAEDASGSGTCNFNPPRSADHFGFLEFSDINTVSRCANFHSTQSSSDSEFISALNNSPSNFMWLTPNDCNNMHDCSVSRGDTYLAGLVPKILTSNLFVKQKAALFVVFDEGSNSYPNDYVYSMWAGSVVKKAYQSSNEYSHYSFLSTIEANWNLPSLTSNDASAPAMTEFFNNSSTPSQLQASLNENPSSPHAKQNISFSSSASGGTSPYTYSWSFGDGVTAIGPTVNHAYLTSGNYTITLVVTDSSATIQTYTVTQVIQVGTPCVPAPYVRADVNHDGRVDIADLGLTGHAFQSTLSSPNWNPSADVNQDGTVNISDLAIIGFVFGQSIC